jgi:hypothetical protein
MFNFRAVVHGIAYIGNLNRLYCGNLFANSGAIFTTHLESQLRPFQPSERHILVCWDTARDVLRQATFAAKYGAQSAWSEVCADLPPAPMTANIQHGSGCGSEMADQNPCLQHSTASYLRLTGTGVGRNSRTGLNQFVFARMPLEKWEL